MGFFEIRECSPGKSSVKEMREFQHIVINGKKYLTGQLKFNDIKISSNDDFSFMDLIKNEMINLSLKLKKRMMFNIQ